MPALQELNYYGLWASKQSAKGTPNVAGTKRLIQVGGDVNVGFDDGSENFSDMQKYGDYADWVNSRVGQGSPVCEATPEELAYLCWLHHGAETVTVITGPPAKKKHAFTPSTGIGFYFTLHRRLGINNAQRHQFNDCRSSQLVIDGSTERKSVHVTPTLFSLDPGETKAADPATAMPTKDPLLFTDGTGLFTFSGNVVRGHTAFSATINEDLQPIYGDDVLVHDLVPGNASVAIEVTFFFDSEGVAEWNRLVYGTAAPTAGTKPIKVVPGLGSYLFHLKGRDSAGVLNGDEFKFTLPGVRWTIPDAPGAAPDGGTAEITVTGQARRVGVQEVYTIEINNDDVAYTT